VPKKIPSVFRSLILGAVLWSAAQSSPAADAGFPVFEAAPCCQLCPHAADPAAYNTKFLDAFRTLVQGSDGWLFRAESDLSAQFGTTPEGLDRLVEFQRALRERGTELVVMVQPPRGLMHAEKLKGSGYSYDVEGARESYRRLISDLRARGVAVPEMETLLTTRDANEYFSRNDHHWTPEGTRRTAKLVADRVLQMPQFKAVKRQAFVTRKEGLVTKNGTLAKAASELCGFGSPKQYFPRYVTEPADSGGDLLGDEAVPQIALVGTSNSGPSYNFSGFISEYLQADVLNVSVIGGGMDGAMLSYLPSEEFRSNPPRILIWEVQHFHNLGDLSFFRQAMPLLNGGCNGKDPVLEREVVVRPTGSTEVLFNGGGTVRPLKGRDYVLDVQFSDPTMLEMRGVVWYTSGNKENLRVEQSQHAPSQKGRFVTSLRPDGNWGDQIFMGFDVEAIVPEAPVAATTVSASGANAPSAKPAAGAPLKVRARLCSAHDTGMRAHGTEENRVVAGAAGAGR